MAARTAFKVFSIMGGLRSFFVDDRRMAAGVYRNRLRQTVQKTTEARSSGGKREKKD